MTNNEILRADLLDIIFDKRNKDYGAYTLRRNYPQRLLYALAGTTTMILGIIILISFKKETATVIPIDKADRGHRLIIIELPRIEQPVDHRQNVPKKPVEKVATVRHTSQVKITPDRLVKNIVPSVNEFRDKQIGTETSDGVPKTEIVKLMEPPVNNNGEGEKKIIPTEFIPRERQPEFPGGMAAMMRFLKKHLETPEELEAGDHKTVQIRFRIETDGTVAGFEIIQSAGKAFDEEVIRVCKKMPKWTPGFQNGVNVPIYYQLPVTFISFQEE